MKTSNNNAKGCQGPHPGEECVTWPQGHWGQGTLARERSSSGDKEAPLSAAPGVHTLPDIPLDDPIWPPGTCNELYGCLRHHRLRQKLHKAPEESKNLAITDHDL